MKYSRVESQDIPDALEQFDEVHTQKNKKTKIKVLIIVLLLLIPIAIGAYFIFRKSSNVIMDNKKIQRPLTDFNTYRIIRLPNKLEAILVQDPKAQQSSTSLSVNSGSFYDTVPGLAHFCEHMLFLGNKEHEDGSIFTKVLYKFSGSYNAFTSQDGTTYYFQCDNHGYNELFDVFGAMFDRPNFSIDFVDKEINAVNSEHEKNIYNFLWILNDVIKNEANPYHPFHQFSCGNKESLSKPGNEKLQSELRHYFNRFYHFDNMKIAMISNQTVEEMEKLLSKRFSFDEKEKLADKEATNIFKDHVYNVTNVAAFPKENLQKFIWFKSPDGSNKIVINFMISSMKKKYKLKPYSYLSMHLNYEGEGGLVEYLKEKNLISQFSASMEDIYSSFSIYYILIVPTEKGIENVDEIVKSVFDYIELIKKPKSKLDYFLNLQKITKINFNFKEKGEAANEAISLSTNMFNYDYQDILSGQYTLNVKDYDEKTVNDFLKEITLENSMITFSTNEELHNKISYFANKVQKNLYYYQKDYYVSKYNEQFIKEIQSLNNTNNLTLREPKNDFLTNNTKLINPCDPNKQSDCKDDEMNEKEKNYSPVRIETTRAIKSFYKVDKNFNLPVVNLRVFFSSDKLFFTENIENNFNAQLLTQYFNSIIRKKFYEITQTNEVGFSEGPIGITLSVSAYDDLVENIVTTIAKEIFGKNPEEIREKDYQQAKEKVNQRLIQTISGLAFTTSNDYFLKLLVKNYFTTSELMNFKDSSFASFKSFFAKFKSDVSAAAFLYGDTTKELSQRISNIIKSNLGAGSSSIPRVQQREVGENKIINYYLKNPKINENNHATLVYYQAGKKGIKNFLYLKLFTKCIGDLFFVELRTKKQLGYIVRAQMKQVSGTLYFLIGVQGTKKYPEEVEEDIAEAIQTALDADCSSSFDELLKSTEVEINNNENTLSERTSFIWDLILDEILDEKDNYKIKETLTNGLKEIKSYSEVKKFLTEIFIEKVRRVGVFNYAYIVPEEDMKSRIEKSKGKKYPLNKSITEEYTDSDKELNNNPFIQ